MPSRFELDTNILVHLIRNNSTGRAIHSKYQPLMADPKPLISIVTVGEIHSPSLQFAWQQAKISAMQFYLG